MYALKCANSVPHPIAPTIVDTVKTAVHSKNGCAARGSTRRFQYVTPTMIAVRTMTDVIAGNLSKMFPNDFQNRSMLKSCARWIFETYVQNQPCVVLSRSHVPPRPIKPAVAT